MEKYKRFKEELADDEAIQKFLNNITTEGWEIIYYEEKAYGGMGITQVIAIGKKKTRNKRGVMSKDSGYLVKTKTGKEGRTYHREGLVNKKMVVYVNIEGKELKMLCDPETIELIGFVD